MIIASIDCNQLAHKLCQHSLESFCGEISGNKLISGALYFMIAITFSKSKIMLNIYCVGIYKIVSMAQYMTTRAGFALSLQEAWEWKFSWRVELSGGFSMFSLDFFQSVIQHRSNVNFLNFSGAYSADNFSVGMQKRCLLPMSALHSTGTELIRLFCDNTSHTSVVYKLYVYTPAIEWTDTDWDKWEAERPVI